jgi:PhnB protein
MKEVVAFLNFAGACRHAMEFYRDCLGADLFLLPYVEAPCDLPPAGERIMHATLTKGTSTLLMAADTIPGTQGATPQ